MDSVYANWRGVVGPKGMSAAQVVYWDDVFSRLAQTPEWRQEALRLLQDPVYMNNQETRRFLDAQRQALRTVLAELGLAK
jgi:putative tricarboxylic transport membrane protein